MHMRKQIFRTSTRGLDVDGLKRDSRRILRFRVLKLLHQFGVLFGDAVRPIGAAEGHWIVAAGHARRPFTAANAGSFGRSSKKSAHGIAPVASAYLTSTFADSMISRNTLQMAAAWSVAMGFSSSFNASMVSNRWSRRSLSLFFGIVHTPDFSFHNARKLNHLFRS